MQYLTCKDANGQVVNIEYTELHEKLTEQGLMLFGMSLQEIAEFRRQYMLKGGVMPITRERIVEIFEKEKVHALIEKVLRDCHSKISLYNEASQKYLGGIEATRLLSNIEETINILQNKMEGE